MKKTLFVSLILASFVLVGTGCKDKEKEAAKVAAEKKRVEDSIKAATPPPPPPAMVASVATAKGFDGSQNAVNPTSDFKPTETIFAVVKSENIVTGNQLAAKWIYAKENKVIRTDSLSLARAGSNTSSFNLKPNKPLPVGDYKVEVMLNGKTEKTADFKVVK
jgi:hypothetical protein